MIKHVLLIEDDQDLLQTYGIVLLGFPHWLLHAHTLEEGKTALRDLASQSLHCALILLNVNLPETLGLAGIVTLRAFIREVSDGVPPIPVIALTGVDDTALRDEIVGWGVREYYILKEKTVPPLLPVVIREVLDIGDTLTGINSRESA